MSQHRGVFPKEVVAQYLAHLKDRSALLPGTVLYRIPSELANRFKDATGHWRNVLGPNQTSALAQAVLASVLDMDVGRWRGSAAAAQDSEACYEPAASVRMLPSSPGQLP